jgi:hypothetical protein
VAITGAAHRARFRKWQNLAPPQTRFVASAVESTIVPVLESAGFERVDVHLRDPEWPVSGSELALERGDGTLIDSVTFNFEKYRTPRFQVHAARRRATAPHEFVRSCNLVARAVQYYHFWGKPWWLPTRLWTENGSKRTVGVVLTKIDQLLRYLEAGERGPNISRVVLDSQIVKA